MIKNMLIELENFLSDSVNFQSNFQSDCLLLGVQSKIYQPLMKREMCGKCMKPVNINSSIKLRFNFKLFQYIIQKCFFFTLLFIHSVRLLIY